MIEHSPANSQSSFALVVFQPEPNILYSLDAAAHLAGVPRRSLLIYCRAGLVQPLHQPNGAMTFTDEAIYTVRRLEYLRAIHHNDLAWLNTIMELENEVAYLRAELRFFRNS
ncbi:MAG: MerR family transcriptional regulator [Pseudomonadota bacterium]